MEDSICKQSYRRCPRGKFNRKKYQKFTYFPQQHDGEASVPEEDSQLEIQDVHSKHKRFRYFLQQGKKKGNLRVEDSQLKVYGEQQCKQKWEDRIPSEGENFDDEKSVQENVRVEDSQLKVYGEQQCKRKWEDRIPSESGKFDDEKSVQDHAQNVRKPKRNKGYRKPVMFVLGEGGQTGSSRSKVFHAPGPKMKRCYRTPVKGQNFRNQERIDYLKTQQGRPETVRKPVEVHSEEKAVYFKQAMKTVKEGIDDDALEMFIANVVEQTEGEELQLASHLTSSYCIEFLLDSCQDLSVIVRFMKAFELDRAQCCGNRYASHVTEILLYRAIQNLQNWSIDIQPVDGDEASQLKAQNTVFIITWVNNFAEFCLENLTTCLEDPYACYVLRTLLMVLGGHYITDEKFQSRRAREQKQTLRHRYLGDEYVPKSKTDIVLNEVPKIFVTALKKLAKAFRKLQDIKTYSLEAKTAAVVQSLLLALKKRLPKRCLKMSQFFMSLLFEDVDSDSVPLSLLHRNCSFVVEKLFETLAEDQQLAFWNEYINNHLEKLIRHPVGNFVLQRLFDVVNSTTQFEVMFQAVSTFFPVILATHHYGIFVSMTSACVRLKSNQAQMTTNLMQCLDCYETEEKQLCFVPAVLGFQCYRDCGTNTSEAKSHLQITLQGSLVVQSLLKFQRPLKVVKSILNMKPDEICYLSCHVQGCHALTCFLESEYVGEKNKTKFLNILKSSLRSVVCDRNGSLTLCRMWMLLPMKHKIVIAEELVRNESELRSDRNALTVMKKFGVFLYKSRREEWKKFLETNVMKV